MSRFLYFFTRSFRSSSLAFLSLRRSECFTLLTFSLSLTSSFLGSKVLNMSALLSPGTPSLLGKSPTSGRIFLVFLASSPPSSLLFRLLSSFSALASAISAKVLSARREAATLAPPTSASCSFCLRNKLPMAISSFFSSFSLKAPSLSVGVVLVTEGAAPLAVLPDTVTKAMPYLENNLVVPTKTALNT